MFVQFTVFNVKKRTWRELTLIDCADFDSNNHLFFFLSIKESWCLWELQRH